MPENSCLLALPDAPLHEVVSWSPDGSTANALLNACRTLHLLRRNPAVAARLLMRCPCQDYTEALQACDACDGGVSAVVHHILKLLRAGLDSGGPHRAPAPLLQALLYLSCSSGDVPAVRSLLALQRSPDVNAEGGTALDFALYPDAHPDAVRALLDGGVIILLPAHMHGVAYGAATPARLLTLDLLLDHHPAARRPAVAAATLSLAILADNLEVVRRLLPEVDIAGPEAWLAWVQAAAHAGDTVVMQALLQHSAHARRAAGGNRAVCLAALRGNAACVALLLNLGADVNLAGVTLPLLLAVTGYGHSTQPLRSVKEESRWDTVGLLLRRGAVITPAVIAAAEAAGRAAMLRALPGTPDVEPQSAAGLYSVGL